MTYYSHTKKADDGSKYGSKLLIVHTEGVRSKALAAFFAAKGLPIEAEKTRQLLSDICLYHDLGKYTTHFQNYLLEKGEFDQELKQHARFGAFVLLNKLLPEWEAGALLAWYIIVHHHASLWDFNELRKWFLQYSQEEVIFDTQMPSFLLASETAKIELKEPDLKQWLQFSGKEAGEKVRFFLKKEVGIQHYYLTNLLFSLLIEADKLDASDTPQYQKLSVPAHLVDISKPLLLPEGFELKPIAEFSQNELRSYVRWQVAKRLEDPKIMEHRLFTLTAPTGIGKTLTALDFALKLRALIREKENREAQIIYGLPFINIIEQSITEYDKVLGKEAKVIAHYQFADALEQVKKSPSAEDENLNYNQRGLMLDSWQSDIVITTFVQLLQTLIGYKNKLLLKFHHFAGSIIILDEIQAIRLEQLPLVGAALNYLAKFLDARILVMTATRPKIFELAEAQIVSEQNEKLLPQTELLPDFEAVFGVFRRTMIIPCIADVLKDEAEFWEDVFFGKWSESKSCLVVVNKVSRSLLLFDYFSKKWEKDKLKNPLYYLSTNIVPAHRLDVIERVKLDLKFGKKPVLISTQSIEAGVDLDFDMAFRDLAPIDSIIQVAGRVNRNNKKELEHAPVYVMDFGDCERIYGRVTTTQARKSLEKGLKQYPEGIGEENYFALINEYFDNVSNNSAYEDSRKIFAAMKQMKYDGPSEKKKNGEKYVSSFQVIEGQDFAASVFVECDEDATLVLEKFRELGRSGLGKFDRKKAFEGYKKIFHQHIITVPKYLPKMEELMKLESATLIPDSIWLVKREWLSEYYDLITGFIRLEDKSTDSQTVSF